MKLKKKAQAEPPGMTEIVIIVATLVAFGLIFYIIYTIYNKLS